MKIIICTIYIKSLIQTKTGKRYIRKKDSNITCFASVLMSQVLIF